MTPEEEFRSDLKKSIFGANEKIDRKELLTDIFKCYVAKSLEMAVSKNGGRIPGDFLDQIKRKLISEFRLTELAEYQKTEEQYASIFDKAIQEIFNDAAHNNPGIDTVDLANQQLQINPDAYVKEGGLYVPNQPSLS